MGNTAMRAQADEMRVVILALESDVNALKREVNELRMRLRRVEVVPRTTSETNAEVSKTTLLSPFAALPDAAMPGPAPESVL